MKRGSHGLKTQVSVVSMLDLTKDLDVSYAAEVVEFEPVGFDSEGDSLENLVIFPVESHDGLFSLNK